MKSNKRLFIENWVWDVPEWGQAEKELNEAIEKDTKWPTHIEISNKYVGIQMEDFELSDFGVAVKLIEWLKEYLNPQNHETTP